MKTPNEMKMKIGITRISVNPFGTEKNQFNGGKYEVRNETG